MIANMTNELTPESVAASLVQKLAAVYDSPSPVGSDTAYKVASVEAVKQRIMELLQGVTGKEVAPPETGGVLSRIADAIRGGASSAGNTLNSGLNSVSDSLQSVSPQSRAALRNALIGSGVGAGVGLLGGGTAYDAARGAAAMGIAGGAGTYAINKAMGLASGPKFVPPSVQRSLDEMRDKGQPTTPQESGGSWNPFSMAWNNPATTGAAGVTAAAGGAGVYDYLDTSRSLNAKMRSPLYHLGIRDKMGPITGSQAPKTLFEKLKHRAGLTPEGRREAILSKTRARLNKARAAAANGSPDVVKGIDSLLGLSDDALAKALRFADKHEKFEGLSRRTTGATSTKTLDAARAAESKFMKLQPGSRGFTPLRPRQFTSLVAKRSKPFSGRSLLGAASMLGIGAFADKVALPMAGNAMFGPSIDAEDVRRMGNP